MSTALKRLLSPQEYLALERKAETRSEFYGGEMFAMSGASLQHSLIKDNLGAEARQQLKDGPCRVVTSDLRVKVDATGLYTYPDIVVFCDEARFEDAAVDTLLNPRVIVEVLSDSTEKYDRGRKFSHYQQLLSIQEYVLVSQHLPLLERFVRQTDGTWQYTAFNDLSQTFLFGAIPVQVPLAEIYRGVTFPDLKQAPSTSQN